MYRIQIALRQIRTAVTSSVFFIAPQGDKKSTFPKGEGCGAPAPEILSKQKPAPFGVPVFTYYHPPGNMGWNWLWVCSCWAVAELICSSTMSFSSRVWPMR